MKTILTLIITLLLCGCLLHIHRATESDIAREHGFELSERDRTVEMSPAQRCYKHAGDWLTLCYDLDAEDSPKRLFPAGGEK